MANKLANFVFEADQYFTRRDGVYDFDPSRLNKAHKDCQLRADTFMRQNPNSDLAVANTFTEEWEAAFYLRRAKYFGFSTVVVEPATLWAWNIDELVKRNEHNVPRRAIERMAERYDRTPERWQNVDSVIRTFPGIR